MILHGVDFSGARRPRKKIWVSTWRPGERATTRNGFTHAELARRIASGDDGDEPSRWLVDAPFTLAVGQLRSHGVEETWPATLDWLASFESPKAWRSACRRRDRKEPKRGIDVRFRTPFAPMNLRLFRQTWHALVSLLRPLREHAHVAILPMDADRIDGARVQVGEGCPASTLKDAGWPDRGYKGPAAANRARRVELIERLEGAGVPLADGTRRSAADDSEGDALDSLLLLPAASRFAAADHVAILREDRAPVEGWVYV